jgi:hypothetical protein
MKELLISFSQFEQKDKQEKIFSLNDDGWFCYL